MGGAGGLARIPQPDPGDRHDVPGDLRQAAAGLTALPFGEGLVADVHHPARLACVQVAVIGQPGPAVRVGAPFGPGRVTQCQAPYERPRLVLHPGPLDGGYPVVGAGALLHRPGRPGRQRRGCVVPPLLMHDVAAAAGRDQVELWLPECRVERADRPDRPLSGLVRHDRLLCGDGDPA